MYLIDITFFFVCLQSRLQYVASFVSLLFVLNAKQESSKKIFLKN